MTMTKNKLYHMVLAGILGLVVRACHLNSAAIVLGLVLGSMCEQNFSRGYLMARANVFQMFNPTLHPIAFVLIIVCIALLVSPVFNHLVVPTICNCNSKFIPLRFQTSSI